MKRIFSILTCLLLLYSAAAYSQCACCSSVGCGDNSGLVSSQVQKGKFLFNVVGRYTSFKPLSSQALVSDANADTSFAVYNKSYQLTYTFSLTYGISNRLNATVTLPYTSIANIQTAMPGESQSAVLGTSAGLSNVKTSLQFVLLQKQYFGGWEVVPSVGIIAPTGVHSNVAKDGTFFDDQFQPGANAWVPVLAIAAGKTFHKVALRATATYVFKDTDPMGNVDAALWNTDVSTYFPLAKSAGNPGEVSDTTKASCSSKSPSGFMLSGLAGIQAEHIGQDIMMSMNGGVPMPDPNIGAFRMYASVGVAANINHRIFIPVSIAVPFCQVQNGYQVSVNYRLNVGLSFLL